MIEPFENFEHNTLPSVWIVANERSARFVRSKHGAAAQQRGGHACYAPSVYLLQSFLEECELKSHVIGNPQTNPLAAPLSNNDEQFLWRHAFEQMATQSDLLSLSDLVSQSIRAHHELLARSALSTWEAETPEQAMFVTVRNWVMQEMAKKGVCDIAQHQLRLITSLTRDSLPSERICCFGFDAEDPWINLLSAKLSGLGVDVHFFARSSIKGAQRFLVRHEQKSNEARIIRQWCEDILREQPKARIGIVSPELREVRDLLLHELRQIDRRYRFSFQNEPGTLIDCSLGEPILNTPVIRHAFDTLRWLYSPMGLSLEGLSLSLRSPFFGAAKEGLVRARIDQVLREKGVTTISLELLDTLLPAQRAPEYRSAFYSANQLVESSRLERKTLADWATTFKTVLASLGWPSKNLNSYTYQAVDRCIRAFDEYAALSFPDSPCTAQDALSRLYDVLSKIVFQAEQPIEAQIFITGLAEAKTLEVSHLWVSSCIDTVFPKPLIPNPMLPLNFQVQHGFSNTSITTETERASRWLESTKTIAEYVIFSAAKYDKEEALLPSPLLTNASVLPDLVIQERNESYVCRTENIRDHKAPPFGPDEIISRDAELLALQATSPLLAFAKYRLHARPVEPLAYYMLPRERGVLLHTALARINSVISNSEALRDLDEYKERALLTSAINGALNELESRRGGPFNTHWKQVEMSCLREILSEWLLLERTRQPGWKIAAIEQSQCCEISGLKLNIRIDRVDQTPAGKVIIDYKSGASFTMPRLIDERPNSTQFQLYGTAVQDLAGVVAGIVAKDECKYSGPVVDAAGLGIRQSSLIQNDSMQSLVKLWDTTLTDLAKEFTAGQAPAYIYNKNEVRFIETAPFIKIQPYINIEKTPQ